ncbi:MAG: hypothetical protein E6999_01145 [Haemophilus parainfluenzae]|jgi:hypothetical protein|nr:hypothetical protein [Haemophilus parainfluenzae]
MKKFDLKAALNGEPICGSEQKCYVVREVTEFLDDKSVRKFAVIFPGSSAIAEIWSEDDFKDDIAMWEEPKISIEDLPKPFKPKDGEPFYYIACGNIYCDYEYSESSPSYRSFSQNGQCFRTEEDAKKWINFMKGMME